MQSLIIGLGQAADYLEGATIERTHDAGHVVAHVGRNAEGVHFVMVNDCLGNTALIESM